MSSGSAQVYVLGCLVVAPVLWGGNFLVGDVLVKDVPGAWANFLRWLIALLAISPFCAASMLHHRRTLFAHWRSLTALGLSGVTLFNFVLYVSLNHAPVSFAAVAFATTPFLTSGLSFLLGEGRPDGRLVAGAAIATVGMLLAQWQALSLGTPALGIALVALAALCWSAYCVAIERARIPAPASAVFPAQIFVGLILMVPLVAASGPMDIRSLDGRHWLGLTYLGLCAGAIAFWLWRHAVIAVGSGQASIFMNLVPITIMVLGVVFLDVPVTPLEGVALSLVLVGLFVSSERLEARLAPWRNAIKSICVNPIRPEKEEPSGGSR